MPNSIGSAPGSAVLDDEDDAERMELALNSDLCSALLDCWDDSTAANTNKPPTRPNSSSNSSDKGQSTGSRTPPEEGVVRGSGSGGNNTTSMWDEEDPSTANLPSFLMDDDDGPANSSTARGGSGMMLNNNSNNNNNNSSTGVAAAPNLMAGVSPPPAAGDGGTTETASAAAGLPNNNTQLHPQAIQSSADCPPHPGFTLGQTAAATTTAGSTSNATSHLLPFAAFNAAALMGANGTVAAAQQPTMMSLLGATAPSAPGQVPMLSVVGPGSMTTEQQQPDTSSSSAASSSVPNATTTEEQQSDNGTPQPSQHQQQQQHPPFLLFDAPMELRANFIRSQKELGLPVLHDTNSYHYRLAMMQQPAAQQQPPTGAGAAMPTQQQHSLVPPAHALRFLDARHGPAGSKREKNAKEQKRAQQITKLIEQLRIKMENDGWKVELKSKFHTLSSCADYVKHLVKQNKEKEAAIEKAKQDLEAKRRRLEEDKKQDPSDPESTTSDLTTDTAGSSGTNGGGGGKNGKNNKSGSGSKKTSSSGKSSANEDNQQALSSGASGDGGGSSSSNTTSPRAIVSHDSTVSSSSTTDDVAAAGAGSGAGGGAGTAAVAAGDGSATSSSSHRPAHSITANQTSSSVSDVTDSNKGESSAGSSSNKSSSGDDEKDGGSSSSNLEACSSVASVSSDAAVHNSRRRRTPSAPRHADVVIGEKRKSRVAPFELDYEEVFVKSNVPQLLSTTAGRIVSWNEFFLKATGLKAEEVKRLTIFSLVQSRKLAKLFDIVAAALRTGSIGTSPEAKEASQGNPDPWNYSAITLPCVNFSRPSVSRRPLFMTVTLMADEDPRKRCFHCVFTDSPGTNGHLGSITQELLCELFKEPSSSRSESTSCAPQRKKRKTATSA